MESVRCPTPTLIDADESPKSAVSPQHPPPVPEEPEKPKSPPNERPPSPEPNCAICLGKSQNKSFTDSCLHQFCFTCLLEWSKVKPECPLCKQSFKSIIHNVRSNEDYDQYHLQTLRPQDNWVNVLDMIQQQRFRYRSTMDRNRTLQRAFEHLEQTLQRRVEPGDAIPPQRTLRRRRGLAPDEFRANVYRQNRWVVGLSYLGVSRDVSPQNFRNHPEEVHRLIPWLNRELQVVTRSPGMATRALDLIVSLLSRHHIRSTEFRQHLEPYLRDHYDHFIHEFYTFARCPYDMIGFDENANYSARGNYSLEVVHEVSDSSDSDVIVLPSENGSSPVPGTSHASTSEVATASPRRPSPVPGTSRFVLPVDQPSDTEANVSSDSSICEVENSDSEGVEIVGYVKPLHERTPEIINLLSDDEESLGRSSHLMLSSTSSGSSSECLPTDIRKSRKKVKTRKVCKIRECSSSDSDESCSCSSAHKQDFLWKPTKWSRSARSRCIISSNSSSSSHRSSSSSSRDRRKSKRQSWRIGSSRGRSPTYNPPRSPSEISSSSRPKLRSIVITRTKMEDKPSKNLKQESNPGPSSHRRKHSKSKKEDKKKRKWKKDSSSDRKKRKLRWSSGSSDD